MARQRILCRFGGSLNDPGGCPVEDPSLARRANVGGVRLAVAGDTNQKRWIDSRFRVPFDDRQGLCYR